MRTIVAAAIRQDGLTFTVPRPGRHHNIIRKMAAAGIMIPIVGEQGFLDSDGNFLDRREAMDVALEAKQLIPRLGQYGKGGSLFSEDVW